jgi:uncharacterized membrane protein YphA (DoxX/SURF4 family)
MTTTMTAETPSKGLHYGLWVVQALAAVAFLGAGMMKATKPLAELAANMAWVPHFPALAVRAIGVAEVLGAFGLVLPSALRVMPRLTPLAAAGLVALMLGAAGTQWCWARLAWQCRRLCWARWPHLSPGGAASRPSSRPGADRPARRQVNR